MSRSPLRVDVAVVGLGAVGSAALAELALAGVCVAGFDAAEPPHDLGSSHGETRLFRVAYAEGEAYVPLARRAVELWTALNARAPETLFHRTGVLYAGPPGGDMIAGVRRSAARWDIPLEKRSDARPAALPAGWEAVFESGAGFAMAEASIAFRLEEARTARAQIFTGARVETLERVFGGWRVKAGAVELTAERLLLAAGGWTGSLRPDLAGLFAIERRVHTWFADPSGAHALGRMPAFALQDESGDWYYGGPAVSGRGVKLSRHQGEDPAAGPDTVDRTVRDSDTARPRDFARRAFPGLGGPSDAAVCFYTMTKDGDFVIEDQVSMTGRMTIAGLSGHGFKFAPALGEYAADRLLGRTPKLDLSVFSPERFA
ncbi:MAG: N-methyl-L-tryptophan oxidase [Oceanicaulis sp.]